MSIAHNETTPQRILVTGGAGYIGSHIVRWLSSRGHHVSVIDNLSRGHRASVAPAIPFLKADIIEEGRIKEFVRQHQPQTVVHCAAFIEVAESVREPALYMKNNLDKAAAFYISMLNLGVSRFILCSTAAVYGEPKNLPITEEHKCRPLNPYGDSKFQLEHFMSGMAKNDGAACLSLRFFNVAGAWEDGRIGEDHRPETHLIPLVIQRAMKQLPISIYGSDYPTSDGTCVRDYVHVLDLAEAVEIGARALEVGISKIYNLGTSHGFSVLQVIQTAEKVLNAKIRYDFEPRRSGDPAVLVASADKAHRELNWRPHRSQLEKMIHDAYQWHRQHPQGFEDS